MKGLVMSTLACSSCFGSASDGETAGMKWAILLLAGLAIVLQLGVARLLFLIVKRDHTMALSSTGQNTIGQNPVSSLPEEAFE